MGLYICQGCGGEHSMWTGACTNCGTREHIALASAVDKMLERVVAGRYKILEKLGQGGMGAVYLAEQVGIGQKVALKFLKADLSTDPEVARRFLNEAKSYARVSHPNAVALHDFGQDEDGNLYISMEYCEGEDLKKLLHEKKRLSVAEAGEIVLQVADVLAHAHSKGVVHRDLKPENIMVRRGLLGVHVKVLDFGIARLMDAGTKLTLQGSIAGTPRYMSPEQVEGRDVDHRADIYSLGVAFFELVTGFQPFDGPTVTEVLRNQIVKPMPHLSEVAPGVGTAALDDVIQKATAKKREQRHEDMGKFAQALSAALSTPGVEPASRPRVTGSVGAVEGEPEKTYVRATDQFAAMSPPPTSASPASIAPSEAAVAWSGGTLLGEGPPVPAPKSRLGWALGATLLGAVVAGLLGARALFPDRTSEAATGSAGASSAGATGQGTGPEGSGPGPGGQVAGLEGAGGREIIDQNFAEARGSDQLAKAQTEYEAGKFEAAQTYLEAVPKDSGSRPRADALLAELKLISDKLKQAQQRAGAGDCDAAIRVFDEVLKVNSKVAQAIEGKRKCLRSQPPPTIE